MMRCEKFMCCVPINIIIVKTEFNQIYLNIPHLLLVNAFRFLNLVLDLTSLNLIL